MNLDDYTFALAEIRHAMQLDCRCAEPINAYEALTWPLTMAPEHRDQRYSQPSPAGKSALLEPAGAFYGQA